MDFYDDFSNKRRIKGLSQMFLVLVGAVLGTLLTLAFVYSIGMPYWAEPPAEESQPPNQENQQPDLELDKEVVLPEYQNTAVIKAAQRVAPAVVGISNIQTVQEWFRGTSQPREVGTGSGVIISSDGLIVTNYHVIHQAEDVVITFPDGEELTGEIVGADPATDLAIIQVNAESLAAATFGDSQTLQVGEMALAIGNPLGLAFQQSVTLGVISATERYIEATEHRFAFVQTDAAINPGNSGGPLVNLKGEVIGINTAKINIAGFEGMGFAIPSDMVKNVVTELIEHGRVIRPWMGVTIDEITPAKAEALGLPVTSGVLVVEVAPGSPADVAGIRSEDIIVKLGGKEVKSFDQLLRHLFEHSPGETVTALLIRDGETREVDITLGELAEN